MDDLWTTYGRLMDDLGLTYGQKKGHSLVSKMQFSIKFKDGEICSVTPSRAPLFKTLLLLKLTGFMDHNNVDVKSLNLSVDEFQTLHPMRNRLKQQERTNKRRKRDFAI